jgi:pimeloyl-ACP methyl ester carboxylesterase
MVDHSVRWLRVIKLLLALFGCLLSASYAGEASAASSASTSIYNPDKQLHVRSSVAANRTRKAIIRYVWKNSSGQIPSVRPSHTEEVSEAEYHPLKSESILRITQLDHVMHLGLSSRSYLFSSNKYDGCLFVFHSGHGGDPAAIGEINLMQRALDDGCDVIALRMPLTNGNLQSTVRTPFGPVRMTDHGALALLDESDFSPIQYFMQPIAASINFAASTRGSYRVIAMAGHSGGGWATTLYAAIDPRIRISFPLYGSLPFPLRRADVAIGDWEQTVPALYNIADYLDLYALGTFPRRRQIQCSTSTTPVASADVTPKVMCVP